ncbi:Rieske 2Fe-2S domain-containing protein [Gordonia sp. TBRC 11910]|uniref:Rieske 2Fe-2S domain-containing protein n=1 Tax=Gordonia asplenii TaxID=2725283 RepID=A0A848L4A8_9ACTN|nr:aromatic ring-hydroxylating dioxygenase subunit alpha [Gordonia asplenii]NMO05252.1 Rieske 2Fe-2S domain-containing protein [Gordonia asplenii]
MTFPRECWYVAARADELGDGLAARRILGTSVVLYRLADGSVAALEDRCAHRPYPLSAGHRDGDRIVCGYHGCTYDPDGTCVLIPSQDKPPLGARVRAFPVHLSGPLVWVWMGTPGGARLRPPPATPELTPGQGWSCNGARRDVAANFLLLHEHYLDLTNVFEMHADMVPPGIEALPPLEEVEVSEVSVSYVRTLPSAPLAPWEAAAAGLDTDEAFSRRETGTFVTPGLHRQTYSIIGADGPVFELVRLHGFTPQTDRSTRVFLQLAWRGSAVATDTDRRLAEVFGAMADRDAAALEAMQRCLDEDETPRHYVNVKADRAALRARRIVHSMIEEERGR